MANNGGGGKPGPALVVGVPLVLLAAAGFFAYNYLIKPAMQEKAEDKRAEMLEGSTSTKKYETMVRVAGDPWSGYSTFRGEPRLAQALAKQDMGIEYIDKEEYYDQDKRMAALAEGKLDLALTTLDAFLQHGTKHKKDGLYPGVIIWNIDESNGGDAIFLTKGRNSFDDVKASDKVCYSTGTPSEHLWDFASLSFANLGDNLRTDNGVVAKDCWDKLKAGAVQVAVLWQPFTAVAQEQGFPKVFATGGQADDVIVDIVVANRDFVIKQKDKIQMLASSYFQTIEAYEKDKPAHGKFITADCGPDCGGKDALGMAVLEGIDFLTYEENMCLWWGLCGKPSKMTVRIAKTGRLLVAKSKVAANDLPEASTILNDSFLVGIKSEMTAKSRLAAEVAGEGTKVDTPTINASEKTYEYKAETAKENTSANVGTLELPSIYFASGSAKLDPNAQSVVDGIADRLRSFPALCVRVYGHTSSEGNAKSNKKLSEDRAQAIVNYLKSLDGIAFPSSRFDVRGFGPEQLILKDGVEDPVASRRTEFKLFNCGAQ
ncbi:MAG: phosphate ABC transporter substrate-binding/OmpA family protein [Polyangiaceae bacterium]|jgi:outer membrane protein OmpA-like peptidoglycan-associated protein|nr:phosphate ABC transporter substrate-binding/OmpA family protein [Polyangiaceae bacterium]